MKKGVILWGAEGARFKYPNVTTAGELALAYMRDTGQASVIFVLHGQMRQERGRTVIRDDEQAYAINMGEQHGLRQADIQEELGTNYTVLSNAYDPLPFQDRVTLWDVMVVPEPGFKRENWDVNQAPEEKSEEWDPEAIKFSRYYKETPAYGKPNRIEWLKDRHRSWQNLELTPDAAENEVTNLMRIAPAIDDAVSLRDLRRIRNHTRHTQKQADARIRTMIIGMVENRHKLEGDDEDQVVYTNNQMLAIINHISDLVYGNRPIDMDISGPRWPAWPSGPWDVEHLFFVDPFRWIQVFFPEEEAGPAAHLDRPRYRPDLQQLWRLFDDESDSEFDSDSEFESDSDDDHGIMMG